MERFAVKEEAGKRYLVIDFSKSPYVASISDYSAVMEQVIDLLMKNDVEYLVLSETYDRVYNEEQTRYLKQIANVAADFERQEVWSYSHLGKGKDLSARHEFLVRVATKLIKGDPIRAYIETYQELQKVKKQLAELPPNKTAELEPYFKTLKWVYQRMEREPFFQKVKAIIKRLGKFPAGRQIYSSFFKAEVKPGFFAAKIFFNELETLELLDRYDVEGTDVRIYRHPDKIQYLYYVNPPEYTLTPEKYFLMMRTKEIVAGYRMRGIEFSDVTRVRKYFERIYESTIRDLAKENNIQLDGMEIKELAKLVARYTIGYGILEVIFSDKKITDVYLDAPLGEKPIYLVHSDYGQCETNIVFTDEEAKALVSRFRAMSGRPFDEAHPVLDFDIPDMQIRLAVIGKPLSPDGIGFAFRMHKSTPWTLPQFIDVKMINPMGAGLASFLIDSQASMLVVGSRGAGKTSLMQSLMLEILQNLRILTQEDTLELPVPYMKRIGFNIQRLKTRPAIGGETATSEVAPEDALRTALRLGDSVLILGEVRSKEAQTLFEAMRVGAVGNVVMGTIHGESAYSIWDRVVNDLGVPTTSFKATSHTIIAAPVRFKGSLKRHRRVLEIVEVGQHWIKDPEAEDGFYTLMKFDAHKDNLEWLDEGFKRSEFFPKLKRTRGLTDEMILNDIKIRADTKVHLVELKRKYNIPELLEAENTVPAHNKLLLMKEKQIEEHGGVDYAQLYEDWKVWVKDVLLKDLLARRGTLEK